jgi:uncharacterized delta-60 repeat protein
MARPVELLERRVLMAAGFLDPSFDGDGRVVRTDGNAAAMVVQADGKILTAGAARAGTSFDFLLSRHNADGSPDTTFGQGGSARTDFDGRSDVAHAVALQSDGRIVVAGSSGRELAVARYLPDGTLDTSFDGDGVATTAFFTGTRTGAVAFDVAVQPDGKIVAVGSATSAPGEAVSALARFNPDGSLDETFDDDGRVTTGFGLTTAYAVALGPGGTIVVGGTADTNLGDGALARYNPDGSLDPQFGPFPTSGSDVPPAGVVRGVFGATDLYDEIRDVAVDAGGSIFAAGTVEGRGMAVARVSSNGASQQTFETPEFPSGPGGGASFPSAGTAIVVRPGESVLVAGYTTDMGGQPENFALVRFNPDGVIDRTFGFRGVAVTDFRSLSGTGASDGPDPQDAASAVGVAPDGDIVLAGTSNGDTALARYLGAADVSPAPVSVVNVAGGQLALAVEGTDGANDVRLYPWDAAAPRFVADMDGSLYLAPAGASQAVVNARGGDDLVRASYPGFIFPVEADGGGGADTLVGGLGPDLLRGGDGHDRLDGAGGADALHGGPGADTADYSGRTDALDISLDGIANDGAAGEKDNVAADVETVLGGSGGDRIVGSAGNNALYGNGGNDTLDGGLGADLVSGGDGGDTLLASETGAGGRVAGDYYWGGDGNDTVDYSGRTARMLIRLNLYALAHGGGRDRDTLRDVEGAVGGSGDDRIEGTALNNFLVGGPGNDVLLGGRGNDIVLGGAGDDVLNDTSGANALDGEAGVDTVNGVREPGGAVVLEAESAALSGATVARDVAGYTGSGYADYNASSGGYVEFTFDNASGAGPRTLTFRYANGGSSDRPLELKVNGVVVQSRLSFPPTGAWTTWRTVSVTVQLAAGVNRIRLTTVGSNGGNLDSLTVD